MPKAKGYRPQFSESAQEQALERAMRKRMKAKGFDKKKIRQRLINRGLTSKAEIKFNRGFRQSAMADGATFGQSVRQLRALKRNSGKLPKKTINLPEKRPGPTVPNPKQNPKVPHMPEHEGRVPRIPNPKNPKAPRMPERDPYGDGRIPLPKRRPHMPERDPRGTMPKVPYPKGQNPWKTRKQRKV